MVGREWQVWNTALLLFPPEMLEGIVGEPQPNVVGDILRGASASFPAADAIVASRIEREVLAFVSDVELAILVYLNIRQNLSFNWQILHTFGIESDASLQGLF